MLVCAMYICEIYKKKKYTLNIEENAVLHDQHIFLYSLKAQRWIPVGTT